MKWTESFRISTHDTDPDGNVRISPLLRYMQDTANRQCLSAGPSNEELRQRGYAFIVSRMALRIYRPLNCYDEILVSSWPCESKGVYYLRCYDIRIGDETVAEASSIWALLDIGGRRVCRVGEISDGYLGGGFDPPNGIEIPMRLKAPAEQPVQPAGEYTVSYRDSDINSHMNNTVYADIMCGFLPVGGRAVSSFCISYQNEAPLGCKLDVFTADCGGGKYFVRTVRKDGMINAEAEIVFRS